MTERQTADEISLYVVELARQHGISGIKSANDALAEKITRLSSDEVVTDATEDLIVALRRANVIDGPMMVDLLGRYLVEKTKLKPS